MAEGEGFEPPVALRPRLFSSPVGVVRPGSQTAILDQLDPVLATGVQSGPGQATGLAVS